MDDVTLDQVVVMPARAFIDSDVTAAYRDPGGFGLQS